MFEYDPTRYAGPVRALLRGDPPLALGPGKPREARRGDLEALAGAVLCAPREVVDRDMATAARAGLWLLFDFLDEAHAVAQELNTREGAYWHGFLHRREGDHGNAKFWFRKVGPHPVYRPLAALARAVAADVQHDATGEFLAEGEVWDPYAFVDLCEACVAGRSRSELLCRMVQRREWELLFDFCYRRAVGERPERGYAGAGRR